MLELQKVEIAQSCEFCGRAVGCVEVGILNLSANAEVMCKVCESCVVGKTNTVINYDDDGILYSNFGCIGGAPEETN